MSKYDIVLCYKCKLTKNSLNNQDFKQKLEPGLWINRQSAALLPASFGLVDKRHVDSDFSVGVIEVGPLVVNVIERERIVVIPAVAVATLVADFFERFAGNAVAVADIDFAFLKVVEASPQRAGCQVGHKTGVGFRRFGSACAF